jgi:hypothetical protein
MRRTNDRREQMMAEVRSMFSLPLAEIARRLAQAHNSLPINSIGDCFWVDGTGVIVDFGRESHADVCMEGMTPVYCVDIVSRLVTEEEFLPSLAAADRKWWAEQHKDDKSVIARPDFDGSVGYRCPQCGVVPESAAEHVSKGHPEGYTPDKPPGWEPDWERVSSIEEIRRRHRAQRSNSSSSSIGSVLDELRQLPLDANQQCIEAIIDRTEQQAFAALGGERSEDGDLKTELIACLRQLFINAQMEWVANAREMIANDQNEGGDA